MRFRAEQHLTRQNDIRAVREQGRRVDCKAFTVWWRQGQGANKPRVCVAASTASVGAAVQRNRAKRRMREIFRKQQQLIPPGCDLLMVARPQVNHWSFAELERTFVEACRRVGGTPTSR